VEKIFNNISKVTTSNLCLHCGLCYSICPVNAIEISDEIERKPVVTNNCTGCGKCLLLCPGINPLGTGKEDPMLGHVEKCYTGYSANSEIRFNASSGGIITSFNLYLLSNRIVDGIICVRQSKESIYKSEVILAENEPDVLSASGSRYAPVFLCSGLKDLPLRENGIYAIVGKPCDIQAITKYAESVKKYSFIKIAIFCAQTPSMEGTRKVFSTNEIDDKEVTSFSYRGGGWPGFFTAYNYNDELILKKKYREVWDNVLCRREFSNKRCFLCDDCTGEYADISVGDAWLDEFIGDNDGHSVIIIRSESAEKHFLDCFRSKYINIKEINSSLVKKSQKNLLVKKNNTFIKRLRAILSLHKMHYKRIRYQSDNSKTKKFITIIKFLFINK